VAVRGTGNGILETDECGNTVSKHDIGMITRTVAACEYELGQLERGRTTPRTKIYRLEEPAKYGKSETERKAAMNEISEMYEAAGKDDKDKDVFIFAFVRIALRAHDMVLRKRAFGIIKHDPMCILDVIKGIGYRDIVDMACAMLSKLSFGRYYLTNGPADAGEKEDWENETGHEEDKEEDPPDLCDIIELGKVVE
jgi:hypothetical protein